MSKQVIDGHQETLDRAREISCHHARRRDQGGFPREVIPHNRDEIKLAAFSALNPDFGAACQCIASPEANGAFNLSDESDAVRWRVFADCHNSGPSIARNIRQNAWQLMICCNDDPGRRGRANGGSGCWTQSPWNFPLISAPIHTPKRTWSVSVLQRTSVLRQFLRCAMQRPRKGCAALTCNPHPDLRVGEVKETHRKLRDVANLHFDTVALSIEIF